MSVGMGPVKRWPGKADPALRWKNRAGFGRLRGAARFAALAALSAAGCSGAPEPPGEPPMRPAKLVEVSAADNRVTVNLPAVFEASAMAELAFQSAGRVESIAVREGQAVAAGAEIARLDQRDMRTDLAAAEARHEAAEAEFGRAQRLISEGAISRAVHEQRRTQLEIAVSALEAALKRLDDSVLRAPFGGIVAAVHIEAFQNVAPQAPAATLQSEGAAQAIAQAPAALIANSGRVEALETLILLDAAPGVAVPGTLYSLSARADPSGQTFEVRIAFEPPEGLVVLPGMTGAVRSTLAVAGGGERLSVPLGALFTEDGVRYVWVVDADSMTVSRRPVTVGEGVGESLPVLDGLTEGETVVAAGVSFLHEGMRVRRHEP